MIAGEPAGTKFLWKGRILCPLPDEYRLECIERVEQAERDRRAADDADNFEESDIRHVDHK
jgi:hypothetical protein